MPANGSDCELALCVEMLECSRSDRTQWHESSPGRLYNGQFAAGLGRVRNAFTLDLAAKLSAGEHRLMNDSIVFQVALYQGHK